MQRWSGRIIEPNTSRRIVELSIYQKFDMKTTIFLKMVKVKKV
jgi:hypothetical protein